MKTVIKGAYSYDNEADVILIPHFTGQFVIVDCTSYEPEDELRSKYSDDFIEENKDNNIEYNGKIYYYSEYSHYHIGEWELLSDISELSHYEDDFNF